MELVPGIGCPQGIRELVQQFCEDLVDLGDSLGRQPKGYGSFCRSLEGRWVKEPGLGDFPPFGGMNLFKDSNAPSVELVVTFQGHGRRSVRNDLAQGTSEEVVGLVDLNPAEVRLDLIGTPIGMGFLCFVMIGLPQLRCEELGGESDG